MTAFNMHIDWPPLGSIELCRKVFQSDQNNTFCSLKKWILREIDFWQQMKCENRDNHNSIDSITK